MNCDSFLLLLFKRKTGMKFIFYTVKLKLWPCGLDGSQAQAFIRHMLDDIEPSWDID